MPSLIREHWRRLVTFLHHDLWTVDPKSLQRTPQLAVRGLRGAYALAEDITGEQLTLRAGSLVYMTLLSLVPLLAVSFSTLKAFGVHNQLEPLLFEFLSPLGPRGEELGSRIIAFVENARADVLGSLGLIFLLYTAISLIHQIEDALNFTWRVRRQRRLSQRITRYLSVLLVGPILMLSALAITASIRNAEVVRQLTEAEPFGTLIYWLGQLVPYFLIIGAFTFIYAFIPNTRVHGRSALVGGITAGLLWKFLAWVFATFVATSARYAAIYSGFAILLLFMIWLFLNWFILFVGARVAYYHQHPEASITASAVLELSNHLKEKLALLIMVLIGSHYYRHRPAWTYPALVERTGAPAELVQIVLDLLLKQGLLVESSAEPPAYVPAQDLGALPIASFLQGIRRAEEGSQWGMETKLTSIPAVEEVVNLTEDQLEEALESRSLKELVLKAEKDSNSTSLQELRSPKTGPS